MSVRIYVEGGGDQSETIAKCRSGFARFFGQFVEEGKKPKVIACGSRNAAYRDFCIALRQHKSDAVLLLVDAEDEILHLDCWKHLKSRDNWQQPQGAGATTVYLMVRCMETWFLADKEALAAYYGKDFSIDDLPKHTSIESVSKKDVEAGLHRASALTTKGNYHKTRHGFDILASLNPEKVARGSVHAKRLIDFLSAL